MTTVPPTEVTFDGLGARTGPLTWGQRWSWDIVRDLAPEEHRINLAMRIPLLGDHSVDDVLAAMADMLARYESLRTTYQTGADGEPEQVVHGHGAVPLTVQEAHSAQPEEAGTALKDELASWRFDLTREMPLRFGIVTVAGRAVMAVVALSNMAVDGWSADVLWDALHAHIHDGGTGDAVPAGTQPLDQVAYESSPAGQAVARAGYEYWREHLPAITSPPSAAWHPAGERPRYWCLEVRSPALAHASHAIARGLQVPASAVLLAGVSALVGLRKGQSTVVMSVLASNRYLPRSRTSVGKFFQSAPLLLDLNQPTFAGYVRHSSSRMLRAVRHGRWDPRQVARLLHGEGPHRGTHHALRATFDYHSQRDPDESDLSSDTAELRTLMERSAMRWMATAEIEMLHFYVQVRQFDTEAVIALWTDTEYLSRADLVSVVLGAERLLVEATGVDPPMSRLSAISGIIPACRAGERA
ncbi:condensation domain-containing protein [Micromonospora sp. NPDC005652]|uniref:condensation domain-containing protein n=1 Tax=Micromonospora sp. NPDC005652 TaxID=3157046 RepID=UPI0033FDCAD6